MLKKIYLLVIMLILLINMSGNDIYIDDMTFEKNQFWTVLSIKNFLQRRRLSQIGNNDMLDIAKCLWGCL